MRRISYCVLLLLLSTYCIESSNAQQPFKDNVFKKQEENHKANIAYGPGGRAHDLDPNDASSDLGTASFRLGRGSYWQKNGFVGPRGIGEAEADELANISRQNGHHPHNIYAPMAGFADIMNSKVYFDLSTNTLPGPLSLYRVAMGLTEPAIALGHHQASIETSAHLTNRYLAEEALFRNANSDADPETRQMKIVSYTNCIANKIRERGSVTSGSADEDQAGWIDAMSRCMADRIESIEKYSKSAAPFNTLDTMTNPGYDFWYHPDNNSNFTGLGVDAGSDDRNEIYLTSLLFNSTNIRDGATINKIKKDFRDLYGDYKFILDKNSTSASASATRSASRDLKYEKVAPTKTVNEWVQESHKEIFKDIVGMVSARCKELIRPEGLRQDPFTQKSFCRAAGNSAIDTDKMISVSAIGYQMDCSMVDMLVHKFNLSAEVQNRTNINICDLKTDPNEVTQNKTVTGREGYRAVDALARGVSTAQILGVAVQTKQIVNTVATTSGLDHIKLKFANQLIMEQVGYYEPAEALDEIVSEINQEFLPELMAETAKKTGKGGIKIAPVIEDSRPIGSSTGGLNGVGGAGQ
jgi:hypothetical protein